MKKIELKTRMGTTPPLANTMGADFQQAFNNYIKQMHTQEECIGFADGWKECEQYANRPVKGDDIIERLSQIIESQKQTFDALKLPLKQFIEYRKQHPTTQVGVTDEVVQIGVTYNSKGKGEGLVIGYIAQLAMYHVRYEDGSTDVVNSKGLATMRDNINSNEYDLLLNEKTV